MPVSYPLDTSGISPANLVANELHSVNEAQFHDYFFIVPNFAPFFIDNFQVTITVAGVERVMVEDVDYSFALQYVTGTRVTGKVMYGAITLHNLSVNGILKMRYQTIGGEQVADRLEVLTVLAEKAYNPRTVIWDNLSNLPASFPPSPHYQDYANFFGQEELVAAMNAIATAIADNSTATAAEIQSFLSTYNSFNHLEKAGGIMTGPLILAGSPNQDNQASTKAYVDTVVANAVSLLSTQMGTISSTQATIVNDMADVVDAINTIEDRLNTGNVGIDVSQFATRSELDTAVSDVINYANANPTL